MLIVAMTTTMQHTDTATRTSSADALRDLMHDALSVAADDTAVSFDGGTVAGRTLLALAAVARQAAKALGADPGITVLAGPGVVVVREFAAAVRLLTAWTYALRAGAALVLPGHQPRRYWRHATATLMPGRGEGIREAAEELNRSAPPAG